MQIWWVRSMVWIVVLPMIIWDAGLLISTTRWFQIGWNFLLISSVLCTSTISNSIMLLWWKWSISTFSSWRIVYWHLNSNRFRWNFGLRYKFRWSNDTTRGRMIIWEFTQLVGQVGLILSGYSLDLLRYFKAFLFILVLVLGLAQIL